MWKFAQLVFRSNDKSELELAKTLGAMCDNVSCYVQHYIKTCIRLKATSLVWISGNCFFFRHLISVQLKSCWQVFNQAVNLYSNVMDVIMLIHTQVIEWVGAWWPFLSFTLYSIYVHIHGSFLNPIKFKSPWEKEKIK